MGSESVQRKLERVRPPRVHITYDTEVGGAIQTTELPFVVGVLADLSGDPDPPLPAFKDRRFVDIDYDNFSIIMKAMRPSLRLEPSGRPPSTDAPPPVWLTFERIEDFEPASVVRQVPELGAMLDLRRESAGRLPRAEGRTSDAAFRQLEDRVRALDDGLSSRLNDILHSPAFQRLEATWRGLHYLVTQTETSAALRIQVLNVSKTELLKDLEKAVEFEQSALFKRVYEERYGASGQAPFGALIGDYEFGNHARDLDLLEKSSAVAAATTAPFFAGAGPSLFGLDSFAELDAPRDLSAVFEDAAHARWRSFRDSEGSCFVGLTLPRVLLRPPYGLSGAATEEFDYREDAGGTEHARFLWGNASYALAATLT